MKHCSRITGPRIAEPLGPLDPRDHGWRADLADIALAGLVTVPNYVEPQPMLASRQTMMLASTRGDPVAVSELLPGERFAMLDSAHGFAWGYALADGYVGHVALDALSPAPADEGRPVGPGDALLFGAPSIKAEVLATLPAGARVHPGDVDGAFMRLRDGPGAGLFLHRRHLLDTARRPDWVEIAMGFLGAPYRWGGRSRMGIDCSGLVQVARQLGGHRCRRDSDMQCADAPTEVTADDVRRGDLACWPGHIGILADSAHLLHANAHHMSTVVESLAEVSARAGAAPRFRRP